MLQRITIGSIKSFLTPTTIPFAPLTLIAGTNSSGKSTAFQTLLLIKQAFEHPALSVDGIHLNGPQASVGSYDDWASKHERTDIHVEVAVTNAPLLKLRRAGKLYRSHRLRRTTPPVPWWVDRAGFTRRNREDASVSGELKLTFIPHSELPNDARLKEMTWTSTATRADGSSAYSLSVHTATLTEEDLDAAQMDSEGDAERYRFSLTVTRNSTGAAALTNGPLYCAVGGLVPTNVLDASTRPAAIMTVVDLLATAFMWARTGLPEPHESDNFPSKLVKSILAGLSSPNKRRFTVLAEHATRANSAQASAILGAVGELRLAGAIVDNLHPPWIALAPDIEAAAQAATSAILIMALRLMTARAKDVPPDHTSDLSRQEIGRRIIARYPVLAPAVHFLLTAADVCRDATLRQQVTTGLAMAEKHADANRHLLLPTTVESLLRNAHVSEGAQLTLSAPSENAIRRYLVEWLFHLGPLRDEPRVLYLADVPVAPHDVGERGQRAISCLRDFGDELVDFPLPENPADEHPQLLTGLAPLAVVVSQWGKYLGMFDELQIDTSQKYGTLVKALGRMDGRGIAPDLTNVGIGVSQVLPLLVLCAAMPVGGCVLIEQPELHLHPSVQSKLAVFFGACVRAGRQVVLESHSEHLVNRMRLMVARGDLPPDDVALVFVERDDFGSTATPIPISADGGLVRWPRGFLDEAERVLSALMRARDTARSE